MTQPDPNAQSGVGGSQSGTDDGTSASTTGTQTGTGAQSGDSTGTQASGQTSTQGMTLEQALAELENQRKRTQAADANQAKVAAELKKFQDAQLTEQERIKQQAEETAKENAKLKADLKAQQIKLAFLEDTTYKWKNPATALRVLDLDGVNVTDDGKVENLKAALDKLAKSDPYLLETTETSSTTETTGQGTTTTGVPANNGTTNAGTNKGQMASRFPAMRTRGVNG